MLNIFAAHWFRSIFDPVNAFALPHPIHRAYYAQGWYRFHADWPFIVPPVRRVITFKYRFHYDAQVIGFDELGSLISIGIQACVKLLCDYDVINLQSQSSMLNVWLLWAAETNASPNWLWEPGVINNNRPRWPRPKNRCSCMYTKAAKWHRQSKHAGKLINDIWLTQLSANRCAIYLASTVGVLSLSSSLAFNATSWWRCALFGSQLCSWLECLNPIVVHVASNH